MDICRPLNYHHVHPKIRTSGDDLLTFTQDFFLIGRGEFVAKLLTPTYGNVCRNDFILITI